MVSGTDAGGKPETWHMSWVDVFVREDSRWKIGASQLVSETVEKGVERDVADGGGQVEPPLNAVGWTDRVSEVLLHAL